jgi:hypothetical protein
MQLRMARLCLDCEEVHAEQQCPVCASDHFTYLTRWVPAPERRARPRSPSEPPELAVYQRLIAPPPPRGRFLARALLGLGAAGVVGLFLGGHRARARPGPAGGENDER